MNYFNYFKVKSESSDYIDYESYVGDTIVRATFIVDENRYYGSIKGVDSSGEEYYKDFRPKSQDHEDQIMEIIDWFPTVWEN